MIGTEDRSDTPAPLQDDILKQSWYHTIALRDGTSTNGIFDTRAAASRLVWPEQIRGGRCLDAGTCDGFWAFEMERQGAGEVIAVDVGHANDVDRPWAARQRDLPTPHQPWATRAARGFQLASSALNSHVKRLECSVYDLDPALHGHFDVVFTGTLLMHLRDPILALERIRAVCSGHLVMIECVDAFLDMVRPGQASARLEPAAGQWWRGNRKALTGALRIAGFEELSVSRPFVTPFGAAITGGRNPLRRTLAAMTAIINRWPILASAPVLVQVIGLLSGTYDIAITAKPSAPALPPRR